jgi:hypothetical protein
VDLAPAPLPLDEAALPKAGEVLGDVRLRQAAARNEVADTALAEFKFSQDRQAAVVGEPMKKHRPELRVRHLSTIVQKYN